MKGLLLKDFYTVTKYCRYFGLIVLVFIAMSCLGNDSSMFIILPVFFAGMIPTTLYSYDEREKWNITCETLPCTRTQYVSGKYLMGLFLQLAVLVLSAIVQPVRMSIVGTFDISEYFSLLGMMLAVGLITPSIVMPLLFYFGTEKGQLAFMAVIFLLVAGTALLIGFNVINLNAAFASITPIVCTTAVLLFALSWVLSVVLYNKREL